MKKHIGVITLMLLLFSNAVFAQLPNKTSIRGIIQDTNNNVAAFATVMLLNPNDSTLVNYTQSNVDGAFTFNNVKNVAYLLKVSHISFLPLQVYFSASEKEVNDLGIVTIKPIMAELMEVVIRTAKAPLIIRGDTIEYDATTFKVPPGSTVEDLLRRLPGIEVDADGNIKTQGKDVRRLYVDGKSFFGDDPKSATKNLDAEAISKVQVFDEKSEQSKLTGVDDGSKEKAMNLQLKEEYKKGSFGKVTVAGGTEGRWAGRGNYNRFNEKNQLSFIGYANNINETGVNWEDYSEFKGQNTFDNYDNGDFGFSNSFGVFYGFNREDSPMNNFDGRGFTKNFGGGANYNFDNKKTKFNVSYFYNNSRLNYDQTTFKQTFLSDSSFFSNNTTKYLSGRGSHSVGSRIEQEIDSNNIIIAKVNFKLSDNFSQQMVNNNFSDFNNLPLNTLLMDNNSDGNSWKLTSAVIYRHRFKKQGRSFAMSGGYNRNLGDENKDLLSLNSFFSATSYTEQIKQLNTNNSDKEQIKSSVIYTEPLSKILFLEVFYNFDHTGNNVNHQAQNPLLDNERVDSLSVFYTNKIMKNRLGTDIRIASNGLNIMLGLAAQHLEMNGEYSIDKDFPLLTDPLEKSYLNLSPKVTLSYEFPNNMWLEMNWGYGIKEPAFSDLQPIPNISNPNYRIEGNPELEPERSHDADMNFYYYNPSSFSYVSIGSNYSYCANKIVYNQTVAWVDSVGFVTTTKPANTSQSNELSAYFYSSFPIVKTVLTYDLSGYYTYSNSGAFVNDVLNDTRNSDYQISTGFSITPGKKLIIELSGDLTYQEYKYSISSGQNQNLLTCNGAATVKWQFAKKFFFESNFDYQYYQNDHYGFRKSLPILNASVRSLIGKKNNFQIRLAAFDIFDKRQDITEYGSQNYIQRSITNTLSRYFMLSVSYNIRGFENKLKKNRSW